MMKYFWKKRGQRGFTLIELVVVLAILGILIALAVPRYLGARRSALIAEGDNVLQEMKTLSWAYYQQYGTFDGIAAGTLGFTAPGSGCWTYVADGTATLATLTATGGDVGARAACGPVDDTSAIITLTLSDDGSSARSQVLP